MNIMRLKELRKKAGLTQTDLANILGFSNQRYNYYETGKREPDNTTLVKLSEYFNVSTDYLLGKTSDPSPKQKTGIPEVGTPEWLRHMFERLGVNVEELTDAQVDILVKNTDSLAQMFRDEVAKSKGK